MSETAGSDGQSCVVNDWLTHDDDEDVHSGTDEVVDKCSLLQPTTRLTVTVTESPVKQEILSTVPYWQTVPTSLDFTSLIVELVHQYASQVSTSLITDCVGQKHCYNVIISNACIFIVLYYMPVLDLMAESEATRMRRLVRQVAGPREKSAMPHCILLARLVSLV